MATISELVVAIKADMSGLDKGLDQTEKRLDETTGKAKSFGQKWDDMKPQLLMAAGMIAAIGAAAFKTAQDFAEAELAAKRLDFAGRLAGSKQAADEINELAGAVQQLTGISGDLVSQLGAEELAKGRSLEQTKELIHVATDLASATGVDLQTAVKQLSDTYSGEAGRISKVIPALKDLTAEQLKNGEGVKVVAQYYRGFAEELEDSTAVSLARASENFGDLSETIGSFFAPKIKALADGLGGMAKGIVDTATGIQRWSDEMTDANVAFNASLGHQESMAIMQKKLEQSYQLSRNALIKYQASLKDLSKEELNSARAAMQAAISRSSHLPLVAQGFKNALAQIEKAITEQSTAEAEAIAKVQAARQKEIDDFLDKQDQMLRAGIITDKEYFENKKAYQEKLINEIKSSEGALTAAQLAEIKTRQGYIEGYQARLIEIEKSSTIEKVAVVRGFSKESTDEYQKMGEKIANTNAGVTKNSKEEIEAQSQAIKATMESIQVYVGAAVKVAGALASAFGVDVTEGLKRIESVAGAAMKIITNPADISAWADIAVAVIDTVSDAVSALSGAETEAARKAREERESARRDIEEKARGRLATTLEALEKERDAEIAKAISVGAQTRDIEIYYARAIARAKMEMNESIINEQKRVEEESARIRAGAYSKAVAQNKAITDALQKAQDERARLLSNTLYQTLNRSGWDNAMGTLNSQIESYKIMLRNAADDISKAEIEAMEMSFALFGDRAEKASQGLSDALISGFKGGKTQSDFKTAIFDMLRNMAIEAAVMAAGIGQKFEEIGAYIAQALTDGFSTAELTDINAMVNSLYSSATAAIAPLEEMFGQMRQPFVDSTSQKTSNNTVIINSPVAVTPSVAADQMKLALQQMAFQGVI